MKTRKLWKCEYCGLETQGYGVYSHQQSCAGYEAERARAEEEREREEEERERQRERSLEVEKEKLESAIKNGAVEGARNLIKQASQQGWMTPTKRMRARFLVKWGAGFEDVVERSDIDAVLPPSANADWHPRKVSYSIHARVRHDNERGIGLDIRLPKRAVVAYIRMGGLLYYLDDTTGEGIAECLGEDTHL